MSHRPLIPMSRDDWNRIYARMKPARCNVPGCTEEQHDALTAQCEKHANERAGK
jgi:hypothetical protein